MKRLIILVLCCSSLIYGRVSYNTYYSVLGLNPKATSEQVKSACRKGLATKTAEQKTEQQLQACEVLKDPTRRAQYDDSIKTGNPSSQTRGSTLSIEGPASQEVIGWIGEIESNIEKLSQADSTTIYNLLGEQLSKVQVPNQATRVFNQQLALKNIKILSLAQLPKLEGAKTGIGLTATAQFNQYPVDAQIFAFLDARDARQWSISLKLPKGYVLSDMFTSLKGSVIDKLTMPDGRLILSTFEYEESEWDIKEGLNFVARLDLSGPLEVFNELTESAKNLPGTIIEGRGEAFIGGVITENIKKLELKADVPIKLGVDFTKIKDVPKSVTKVFKRIYTEHFFITAAPGKQEIGLGGKMKLILGTQPAPLTFTIKGSAEKTKIKMAGNMDGMVELKWVAIGNLGLQIDIDEGVEVVAAVFGIPFTGIGMTGTINLGKKGESRAQLELSEKISITSSDIPDLLYDVKGKNIRLDDFIAFLSKVAAKQGLTKKPIPANRIPTMQLTNITGYFSTTDTQIGQKSYKAGIDINADVKLLKQTIAISFFLDPDPEHIHIKGQGHISPIDLKIIKLSGNGCPNNRKPGFCLNMDFQANDPINSYLYLSGKLEIPKLDIGLDADIKFDSNKYHAKFDSMVKDFFEAHFDITLEPDKLEDFEAQFKFKADFNKFLHEYVLKDLQKIKSQEIQKAERAKGNFTAAQGIISSALRVEEALQKRKRDEVACKKGDVGKCFEILGDEVAYLAKLGIQKIAEAEVTAAKGTITAYQKVLDVIDVFQKLVEAVAAGVEIAQVKRVEGSASGKDIQAGKMPQLDILEIRIQIPSIVPKIGGKGKTITLKDVSFDFNNPIESVEKIAEKIGDVIEQMIK